MQWKRSSLKKVQKGFKSNPSLLKRHSHFLWSTDLKPKSKSFTHPHAVQNIFCVTQKKVSHTGLEKHEGRFLMWMMTGFFYFLINYPFSLGFYLYINSEQCKYIELIKYGKHRSSTNEVCSRSVELFTVFGELCVLIDINIWIKACSSYKIIASLQKA